MTHHVHSCNHSVCHSLLPCAAAAAHGANSPTRYAHTPACIYGGPISINVVSSASCFIMCNLFDKVEGILRACGVPWTAARIRFVRVYCIVRHLQGHRCARRRDIANVVSMLLGDYHAVGASAEPSRGLLHSLWLYESNIVSNVRRSPYFASGPPAFSQ